MFDYKHRQKSYLLSDSELKNVARSFDYFLCIIMCEVCRIDVSYLQYDVTWIQVTRRDATRSHLK